MSDSFMAETSGFARCAHYGRYSTVMQRKTSLVDQLRVCSDFATKQGWVILDEHIYTDAALSGRTKAKRKGLALLEAAAAQRPRPFDYVLFDDTSRLGRDIDNVRGFEKLMRFFGVKIRFVSQQLDSCDPNFELLLTVHSIVDSQFVTRLKSKVHSAQMGRVLAGFTPGSWPYGYRGYAVASTDSVNAIGRAATSGTLLEVIESEAKVINRVFQLYADGYSMWRICVKLNQEKVPRNIIFASHKAGWDRDAIKRMLHNEKYRGISVWNTTTQLEHPTTGRITKESKPAHEHVRVAVPHLRIVTDELWEKVVLRLEQLQEKQNARILGGYNRAKNKEYVYSGLLFCGVCGRKMHVGGKGKNAVYACPNHRLRRGCTNNLCIRQDRAAAQITEVLANQLFKPEYLDYLVSSVFNELKKIWKMQSNQTPGEGIHELEQARHAYRPKMDNLVDLIEQNRSPTLMTRLAAYEFEVQRIEDKLNLLKGTKKANVTEKELQALVREKVANLLDVLKTEAPLARKVLQQHLTKLSLYPGESKNGPIFEVIGELELFNASDSPKVGVLLGCEGTETPQQHTDRFYRFHMQLDPRLDLACNLLEPLFQLLKSEPQLTKVSRTPKAWAQLLRGVMPDGTEPQRPLRSGAVGWCFNNHRHLLEERLHLVETVNPESNGPLYQISIRAVDCTMTDMELVIPAAA